MRTLFKYTMLFIFLVLFSATEHAAGLPLFSLALSAIFISFFSLHTENFKILAVVVCSLSLSALWVLPLSVSFFFVFLANISLEYQKKILVHQSTRFFFVIVLSSIAIGVFTHFQVSFMQGLYFFFSSGGLFFFTRYWLYQRNSAQVLSLKRR